MPRAAAAKAAAKFAKMDDDAAFEAAMKADELAAQKRKAEAAARPKKKKKEPEVEVEYEIEAILDVKKASNGELVYLVKWKGFDDEDENTWEPEDEDSVPFADYIAANGEKVEAAKAAEPEAAEVVAEEDDAAEVVAEEDDGGDGGGDDDDDDGDDDEDDDIVSRFPP